MNAPANSSGEAHEGWMQSSTCRAVDEAGRTAGRAYGLAESISRTLAWLLSRQARQKFGGADAAGGRRSMAWPAPSRPTGSENWGDGLVGSSSWNEWLAASSCRRPPETYLRTPGNLDIDLEHRSHRSTVTWKWDCLPAERRSSTFAFRSGTSRTLTDTSSKQSKDRAEAREDADGRRVSDVAARRRAGY